MLTIGWFALFSDMTLEYKNLFYYILGSYAVHLIYFYFAIKNKFDIKLAYLSVIIYDLILVPFLVLFTGGVDSSMYLLLFPIVFVAAYILTFWFSLSVAIFGSLGYLGVVYFTFTFDNLFDVTIRLGFVWVYYLVILYASEYMRKSENRLLKLFNTLNMRTSELEKSQAQIEMIYENTRILASILDIDSIIKEVMRLTGEVFDYDSSALVFRDSKHNFYYRGRSNSGKISYHPKALDITRVELLKKVIHLGEPITVIDILKRDDYLPLSDKCRSLMIVPLSTHGLINGCLIAESAEINHFGDRDIKMLSAIARSAALALENAALHKRTEELTIIDELTSAYNYRYFAQKLQEEKRRAARYSMPLSIIMVDIDWFKKLNDSYGHEIGNFVLRQLSFIIKQCIRDVDIFVRYGGEEFAIILPQTPQNEAMIIGERIRSQVEKEVFLSEKGRIKITVSVGLSSFPENGRSEEELVSIADKALYKAKGDGRNLVCVE